MFGSKSSSSSSKKSDSISTSPNSINSLVAGTKVDGNITATNDFRIDGKLNGKLECKGRVIIGVEGSVVGEVFCQNAVIEGHFDGILKVKDGLQVKETAKVTGDVDVDNLDVSAGAVFNVSCNMGKNSNVKSMSSPEVKNIQVARN